MNRVCLLGRITAKPELKYTSSNVPTTRFTLAVNEYNVKRNERIATFVEIVAFDKKAIILAHNVGKGSRLAVEGKIRTSNYVSETGEKRYKVDIILSEFTFIDSKKKVVNEVINEEVPF